MVSEDRKIKDALLSDLEARRTIIEKMGGEANVARQLERGKLNARERIDTLLDDGTFQEIGAFAINRAAGDEPLPADGVITGYGEISGRPVYVFAQDFTCAGGTLSETHAQKICRVLDLATKAGCPVIGLNDSGGARIQDGVDALSGYGKIFYRNTMASGVIPQICAIIGPCAGGAVYSPALMDFVFMVKGISCAFITGPRVVKAVMGQDISEEALGGALVAQRKAGVVCRSEDSEAECLSAIRELLGFLPSNNRHLPPHVDTDDPPERRDKHLFDIIPNQPRSKAGAIDSDASDKAARFIRFCDAFNIPLITLVDVPGYLPGTDQEWNGIIRHGAKMLYAYSEATVPKITLILRKAYGGAYLGMCSRDLGADCVLCWPSAELAVIGGRGAAEIIHHKELQTVPDRESFLEEKAEEYRRKFANPYLAAAHLHVDDIIDPADSRPRLIRSLEMAMDKAESRPEKKHGIMPL